jgi:hypothetical protein
VYVDANDNAIRETGEVGIPGVTVTLTGIDMDGNTVTRSTSTAADGSYSFDELLAGTYTITEIQPSGFADGRDTSGTQGGTVANDIISGIVLTGGANGTDYRFGEQTATISGHLFLDMNGDGIQQPGEPNMQNVSIIVTDSTGKPQVIVTDSNGNYTVVVQPGQVTVQVDLSDPDIPAGAVVTTGTLGGTATQIVTATANNNSAVSNIGFNTKPTAVTLASFTAAWSGGHVLVRWTTGAEFNTWGYQIYRSTDGVRAHAVKMTPALILSQGRGGGGASYQWIDLNVEPYTSYSYWLEEQELAGSVNEYGPAKAASSPAAGKYTLFVPVVMR